MSAKDWISAVLALVSIVVVLTGLVVAARGSYNKARIQALREDLEDSRKREDDREREIKHLQQKVETLDIKMQGLLRENTVLSDMVTQRVEIATLQGLLETHHTDMTIVANRIADSVKVLQTEVGRLKSER